MRLAGLKTCSYVFEQPYTSPAMALSATPPAGSKREAAAALLRQELARMGRDSLAFALTFSDTDWREAMANAGCPAWTARLASPTARRGTRGKLGMATVCHLRHGHPAVVYVRVHGRDWPAIAETVRHEALHVARPSYNHRQVEAALQSAPVAPPRSRKRRRA
jgi:hypothetical protein